MIKKILLIIGVLLLSPGVSLADTPGYCNPPKDPNEVIAGSKLYRGIYCAVAKGVDTDEHIASTAKVMGFEDENTVQLILDGESYDCAKDVPKYLQEKYFNTKSGDKKPACAEINLSTVGDFYNVIKTVYDRERQLFRWRAEIEPGLKAKEVWMNGTTSDGPFDLIVDLNLAEIVLFGSEAVWNDDVYKWPKKTDEENAGSPTGSTGSASGDSGTGNDDTGGDTGTLPEEEIPGDLTCISPKNPEDLPETGDDQAGGESEPELVCRDPEGLTLRKYAAKKEGNADSAELPISCPAGTYATYIKPEQTPSATPSTSAQILTGTTALAPRVAGALRKLPPSGKPACPAGSVPLTVSSFGNEEQICVPQGCPVDFEKIRDKLSEGKSAREKWILQAIEASFCVKVIPANRPVPDYEITEGCIDCHISGMIEVLESLRNQNVSPMENTKNAFAMSNRWGPKLSFDFKIYVKNRLEPWSWEGGVKYSYAEKVAEEMKKIDQAEKKSVDPTVPCKGPNVAATDDPSQQEVIEAFQEKCEQESTKQKEVLKAIRASSEIQNDAIFSVHINEMLLHLRSTFENIRNQFSGFDKLPTKEQCKC